jgi:hypothetical protein
MNRSPENCQTNDSITTPSGKSGALIQKTRARIAIPGLAIDRTGEDF